MNFYRKDFVLTTLLLMASVMIGCVKNGKEVQIADHLSAQGKLIFSEDFEEGLENWKAEQMPGGIVENKDGKLEIVDAAGCTIWFTKKLEGPIMIEYDAVVLKNGGPHDRVSDLNCFWMAVDPENPTNLFENSEKRGGKFSNYDSLQLYYVGLGGHFNTKTRFRRYVGDGQKPLLPEHDLTNEESLIQANQLNKIRIIAFNGIIQYYRNGKLLFSINDENPYTSGYFGLRTVDNHMTVDNFQVYQLEEQK